VEVVWDYFGSGPRVSAMTKASKTRPHLAAPSPAQPSTSALGAPLRLPTRRTTTHLTRFLATDDLATQAEPTPPRWLYGLSRFISLAPVLLPFAPAFSGLSVSHPHCPNRLGSVVDFITEKGVAVSRSVQQGELSCVLRCTTNIAEWHVAGVSFIESDVSCSILRHPCQRRASGGVLRRAFRRTGVRSGEQQGR
jgi:hypothetical protein